MVSETTVLLKIDFRKYITKTSFKDRFFSIIRYKLVIDGFISYM